MMNGNGRSFWENLKELVAHTPALTAGKESELLRRWQQERDEQARHTIIKHFMVLVIMAATKYSEGDEQLKAELFQAGIEGLYQACDRFDRGRQSRFSTCAWFWIADACRKEKNRWVLPLSVPLTTKQVDKRRPNPSGRTRSVSSHQVFSLDAEVQANGSDATYTLAELIVDKAPQAEEALLQKRKEEAIKKAFASAFAKLDHREQIIVRGRIGYGGEDKQTLEQLAVVFKISRERVRQIEKAAMRKFRRSLQPTMEGLRL